MTKYIISDESIENIGRVIAARQQEEKQELLEYWEAEATETLEKIFNHLKYNPNTPAHLLKLVGMYETAIDQAKDLRKYDT
jgi:DNA-binding protein H-NS